MDEMHTCEPQIVTSNPTPPVRSIEISVMAFIPMLHELAFPSNGKVRSRPQVMDGFNPKQMESGRFRSGRMEYILVEISVFILEIGR